ncbi:hypothetical protein GBF38_007706 [Nibea albiflora]|uniref:Uncharacterized protein n=1 Tax=Nibea albiflora TaxID=240163 RepID=A0ACB7EM41_NIBAL|nr:hypothetical protein GBF38_007706 [Nibea albiflora]
MLTWVDGGKEVLDKFANYIRPRKNKRIARHRFKQRKQGELGHSNKVLRSYSNHKVKPVAAANLPLKYKDHEANEELEIVDIVQENMLSGTAAEALGLTV